MGEKQCGKCGEMVDEAKAFCPGCGNAFVEEKTRTTVSDFDLSSRTVQLSDSMYNQMLSDMGLSISKKPNRDEKLVEQVAKAAPVIPASSPEQTPAPLPARRRALRTWIIVGVAIILLTALAVIAAAVGIILYSR